MFSYYDTLIMLVEANRPIVLRLCWAYVASCNENQLYVHVTEPETKDFVCCSVP